MKTNNTKLENSLFIYMMCKFVRAYIQTNDIGRAIRKVDHESDLAINFVDLLYMSNVCSSLLRLVKPYIDEDTNTWSNDIANLVKGNAYVTLLLKYLHSEISYDQWCKLSKKIKWYLNSDNSKSIRDYVNGYFTLRDSINDIEDWSCYVANRYSDVDPSVVKSFITAFYNSHCREFKPKLFSKISKCAEACVKGTQYMKTQVSGVRYKAIITNLGYSFSLPSSAYRFDARVGDFSYEFDINSINTRIIYNTINFLYVNSSLLENFISRNFVYENFSVPQLIRDTLKYALQIYVK